MLANNKTVRFGTNREEKEKSDNIGNNPSEHYFNTPKSILTPAIAAKALAFKDLKDRSAASVAPPSTLMKPNYEDILRRVSVVINKHIQVCESRLKLMDKQSPEYDLIYDQLSKFSEELYTKPKYAYHFKRTSPGLKIGFSYCIKQLEVKTVTPTASDIHTFISDLFVNAQLSAECSIVCLIYVERLMENSKVPLVSKTWRPCLLCGLLLASKVWQDLSSWNSEIAQIYPEFPLSAINQLEMVFCREMNWDLNISSSLYAKYYFALRSLTEKQDFRRNYNMMMLNAPGAQKVQERSEEVNKLILSKSM